MTNSEKSIRRDLFGKDIMENMFRDQKGEKPTLETKGEPYWFVAEWLEGRTQKESRLAAVPGIDGKPIVWHEKSTAKHEFASRYGNKPYLLMQAHEGRNNCFVEQIGSRMARPVTMVNVPAIVEMTIQEVRTHTDGERKETQGKEWPKLTTVKRAKKAKKGKQNIWYIKGERKGDICYWKRSANGTSTSDYMDGNKKWWGCSQDDVEVISEDTAIHWRDISKNALVTIENTEEGQIYLADGQPVFWHAHENLATVLLDKLVQENKDEVMDSSISVEQRIIALADAWYDGNTSDATVAEFNLGEQASVLNELRKKHGQKKEFIKAAQATFNKNDDAYTSNESKPISEQLDRGCLVDVAEAMNVSEGNLHDIGDDEFREMAENAAVKAKLVTIYRNCYQRSGIQEARKNIGFDPGLRQYTFTIQKEDRINLIDEAEEALKTIGGIVLERTEANDAVTFTVTIAEAKKSSKNENLLQKVYDLLNSKRRYTSNDADSYDVAAEIRKCLEENKECSKFLWKKIQSLLNAAPRFTSGKIDSYEIASKVDKILTSDKSIQEGKMSIMNESIADLAMRKDLKDVVKSAIVNVGVCPVSKKELEESNTVVINIPNEGQTVVHAEVWDKGKGKLMSEHPDATIYDGRLLGEAQEFDPFTTKNPKKKFDPFVAGYIAAALFSVSEEDAEELGVKTKDVTIDMLAPEAIKALTKVASDFWKKYEDTIEEADLDPFRAGTLLYYAHSGAGVSWLDDDDNDALQKLDNAPEAQYYAAPYSLYAGDDGKLYREGIGSSNDLASILDSAGLTTKQKSNKGREIIEGLISQGHTHCAVTNKELSVENTVVVTIPGKARFLMDAVAFDARKNTLKENVQIIDGRSIGRAFEESANPKWSQSSNNKWVDATGDVVTGDIIKFKEAVFSGSHRRPKFAGEREVVAKITSDSYGKDKQQHTFSIEVLESSGEEALTPGTKTKRKGRNIYKNGTMRLLWEDEKARSAVADEKHSRGDAARSKKDRRIRGSEVVNEDSYDAVDEDQADKNYDDWEKKFKPQKNHLDGNASYDGYMYETYGDEEKFIKDLFKKEPDRIWTLVGGDEGTWISSGYHHVNRIGYFVTKKACKEDCEYQIEVYDDEDNLDESVVGTGITGSKKIGEELHQWHASQSDPVYQVGSMFIAGKKASSKACMEAAKILKAIQDPEAKKLGERLHKLCGGESVTEEGLAKLTHSIAETTAAWNHYRELDRLRESIGEKALHTAKRMGGGIRTYGLTLRENKGEIIAESSNDTGKIDYTFVPFDDETHTNTSNEFAIVSKAVEKASGTYNECFNRTERIAESMGVEAGQHETPLGYIEVSPEGNMRLVQVKSETFEIDEDNPVRSWMVAKPFREYADSMRKITESSFSKASQKANEAVKKAGGRLDFGGFAIASEGTGVALYGNGKGVLPFLENIVNGSISVPNPIKGWAESLLMKRTFKTMSENLRDIENRSRDIVLGHLPENAVAAISFDSKPSGILVKKGEHNVFIDSNSTDRVFGSKPMTESEANIVLAWSRLQDIKEPDALEEQAVYNEQLAFYNEQAANIGADQKLFCFYNDSGNLIQVFEDASEGVVGSDVGPITHNISNKSMEVVETKFPDKITSNQAFSETEDVPVDMSAAQLTLELRNLIRDMKSGIVEKASAAAVQAGSVADATIKAWTEKLGGTYEESGDADLFEGATSITDTITRSWVLMDQAKKNLNLNKETFDSDYGKKLVTMIDDARKAVASTVEAFYMPSARNDAQALDEQLVIESAMDMEAMFGSPKDLVESTSILQPSSIKMQAARTAKTLEKTSSGFGPKSQMRPETKKMALNSAHGVVSMAYALIRSLGKESDEAKMALTRIDKDPLYQSWLDAIGKRKNPQGSTVYASKEVRAIRDGLNAVSRQLSRISGEGIDEMKEAVTAARKVVNKIGAEASMKNLRNPEDNETQLEAAKKEAKPKIDIKTLDEDEQTTIQEYMELQRKIKALKKDMENLESDQKPSKGKVVEILERVEGNLVDAEGAVISLRKQPGKILYNKVIDQALKRVNEATRNILNSLMETTRGSESKYPVVTDPKKKNEAIYEGMLSRLFDMGKNAINALMKKLGGQQRDLANAVDQLQTAAKNARMGIVTEVRGVKETSKPNFSNMYVAVKDGKILGKEDGFIFVNKSPSHLFAHLKAYFANTELFGDFFSDEELDVSLEDIIFVPVRVPGNESDYNFQREFGNVEITNIDKKAKKANLSKSTFYTIVNKNGNPWTDGTLALPVGSTPEKVLKSIEDLTDGNVDDLETVEIKLPDNMPWNESAGKTRRAFNMMKNIKEDWPNDGATGKPDTKPSPIGSQKNKRIDRPEDDASYDRQLKPKPEDVRGSGKRALENPEFYGGSKPKQPVGKRISEDSSYSGELRTNTDAGLANQSGNDPEADSPYEPEGSVKRDDSRPDIEVK